MADSSGIDALTGGVSTDWAHTCQSLRKILTTFFATRVMRREFGASVPDYIDGKLTSRAVLRLYVAAATAIRRWEPRFRMRGGAILAATENGVIEIVLTGTYYPRGHKGDYSVAQDASLRVPLESSR